MAIALGKRKRADRLASRSTDNERIVEPDVDEDAQAIFRRHFEAQFEPLPKLKKKSRKERAIVLKDGAEDEAAIDEEPKGESDWSGLSDGGNVEIVEHTVPAEKDIWLMSKAELKRFMSSKPPSTSTTSPSAGMPAAKTTDDPTEKLNVANDLALQRLLSESHLLSTSTRATNTSATLAGTNRHKATDLRIQALGAKSSIHVQAKMPMAMRRGITAKKLEREETRRKEAREAGVILERVGKKGTGGSVATTKPVRRRERGVDAPGVGRFKGGMLTLSKKDVREIEGPRSRGGRGGRGGSRGRGGRGGRTRG